VANNLFNLQFKMKKLSFLLFFLLLTSHAFAQKIMEEIAIEPGVSLPLATSRKAILSNIQYQLHFDIPADKNLPIAAKAQLTFNLKNVKQQLQLDFKQNAAQVKQLVVNGKSIAIQLKEEHLLIPAQYLRQNANTIEIEFIAGSESLNRNPDYLYALFVPDHARSAFPCFDQPDLKAKFLLSLTVPKGWHALANGALKDSVSTDQHTTYAFANSDLLPTYLFSFTAGKYLSVKQNIGHRKLELLHRETDQTKIKLSTDSIFQAHADALNFLETYTGIRYPFQKIGFVAIPDFQFGGMEHPGVVHYKASSLFLDEGATKDQFISRSTLISHETAHMWFGDLVTMKWFNDVWMKEVFANFMADKVTEKLMGEATFNLKFLQDHYPAAYGVDRTLGANPIRQQLDNLQDAGSMYGNIIYHKAPIMMRQLELLMGSANFQKGIQDYLKQYAYGNATWNDLIRILSKYTVANLQEWNKVWVNLSGRPIFNYHIAYQGNTISNFTINHQAEFGTDHIWPQVFTITLIYANTQKQLRVNMNQKEISITEAKGMGRPLYVLFNADAMGYGLFPVDKAMGEAMFQLEKPLQRATAYINAYENMLAGKTYSPMELLALFAEGIGVEKNEMNLKMLTGYLNAVYWNFISPSDRLNVSKALESSLWTAMTQESLTNNKKILFKTYQEIYLSSTAGENIYRIWETQQAPIGMRLTEDDYTSLAFTLALKSDTPTNVLVKQRDRIVNQERKNRLTFLMPALSTDVQERNRFFESLADRKNRSKEAWVSNGLAYLNHPLRQQTAVAYLPKSLALVAEIQQTGDIFFPQSWLSAVFGSYQSAAAYQIVVEFLKANPNYNPKLKGKILQATDNLYRAQQILRK
jgi:aminopeptidase N